jgi:hypothetical protein
MTVAAAAAKAGPYTGNDSASAFDFAFKVFADTDIRVVATVIATAAESDLVLNTDYTVARNVDQDNDPGGTVTYKVGGVTTAYPSTHKLTIVGDFVYEQPTDIPNGGAFFATVIENALDRLTLLIKQAQEKLERAVTVDVSDTTDPSTLIDTLVASSAAAVQAAADSQAAQALAESAAANLPNAVTAGANAFLKVNPTGDGWLYSALQTLNAGANIASATTLDLSTAAGNCPRITGTTTTSAVTMNTGQQMLVVADAAWPLTYHATTNKLNTGESYTCAAGDVILYHKDLSGVVHGTILPVSAWTDYSASSTIVGWSSFTYKEIYTRKIGSLLFVNFRLQGTSNATGATFTLPYSADGLTYSSSAYIIDNGTAQANPGWVVSTAASATITVYKDMAGAAFTNSGTKAVRGQFFVHIA